MKKRNTRLRLGALILMMASVLITSCGDSLMEEVSNTKDEATRLAETKTTATATRYATGYQGFAYERLSNGSIGPKIAGVKIVFTKEDGSASYTVYTNSSGYYKVTLAAGRYYVVATHADYEIYNSAPGFFVVTGSNGYQTGNFFLEELTYGRQGFTYQRNWNGSIGPKIGYVKLTFTKDDGLYTKVLYSNSSGYYKVKLPKGKYYLKAEKSGYYTYTSNPGVAVVSGSGYSTLNFFLKKKLIIAPF